MLSEPRSRRSGIRVACLSLHVPLSLLLLLPLLASAPVACARSHPHPDALAATHDALAGLDEFDLRQDGFLAAALTGEPARWVGPVEVRDHGAGSGEFEIGVFYTRADGERWRRAGNPNLDGL